MSSIFYLCGLGAAAAQSASSGYQEASSLNDSTKQELLKPENLAIYNAVRTFVFSHTALTFARYGFKKGFKYRKRPDDPIQHIIYTVFSDYIFKHYLRRGLIFSMEALIPGIPLGLFLGAVAGKFAVEKKERKPLSVRDVVFYEAVSFKQLDSFYLNEKYFK